MSNREEFSLEDEYATDDVDSDKFIVVPEKKKPGRSRSPQAAWSRVEDVLAERRLKRELTDYLDADEA